MGRRKGLKIPWGNTPCGFESHPGHRGIRGDNMTPDVLMVSIVMGALAFTGTVASTAWAVVHFKVKKKELEAQGSTTDLVAAVEALREDLDDTRAQLAETQERLDFAERLLTAGRAPQEPKGG